MRKTAPQKQIERISKLSREEFVRDYLAPQIPVILTDVASDWPAISKWSLEYLKETHDDHQVFVEHYPTANRNHAYTYVQMTVGEYIRSVTRDPDERRRYYLADTAIETVLPQIKDDVGIPALIENRESLRAVLFFGQDTFSATHYHRYNIQAFLAQITGSKEVVLYPAKQTGNTYPHPWYGLRPNFSRIDMEFDNRDTEFEEYPKLAQADSIHVKVEPGEVLFIPDHWMHSVAGLGENISVTYFWREPWRYTYLPGVARDLASSINKKSLLGVAWLGKRLGIQEALLHAAVSLGIVPATEQETVRQHLEEYRGQLPGSVKTEQENKVAQKQKNLIKV